MSLIFSCGFSRAAVKESFHKPGSATKEADPVQRWKNYIAMFDETAQSTFALEKPVYMKKSRTIYDLFRKMKSQSRNDYLEYFSLENWKTLPASQKSQHTMSHCDACQAHHFCMQSLFPVNTTCKLKPQKLVKEALVECGNKGNSKIKPTQKAMENAVKLIYSKIDRPFEKVFKVSFAQAQTKVSELKLQRRKNKIEKKRERRQRARQEKQNVQEEWSKRDADTMMATRQSLSQRAKQRSTLHFESPQDAAQRVQKRKRLEDLGQRKRKRHSPPPDQVNFQKENLLQEVTNMKDGEKINYSDLARRYGLADVQLGNMVVKEYLETQGVDVQRFQKLHRSKAMPRRRLHKMVGGDITVPVPRTNREIKETLKNKLDAGEYAIGELVVPKMYKKLLLKSDCTLQEVQFTVSARKIPLQEIRKRELQRFERLGVVRGYSDTHYEKLSDQEVDESLKRIGEYNNAEGLTPVQRKELLIKFERTRHLMVWGDNSTILNHGHILYLVQCLYDPAFFYSPEEMKVRGYGDVDVPAIVERPHLYILGRCGSKEIEQLAYVDTRQECLNSLANQVQTSEGVKINDVMRFFHGDGPEQQFESGEQKGGNAGCSACSGDARRYRDLTYCFRLPQLSLADRQTVVLAGPAGKNKRNGGIRPFKDMTVVELRNECRARGLNDEGLRNILQNTLKEHLGGIQRVPAMLINQQGRNLEDVHLGMYEVLATEPLHDVKGHISNIITEIVAHLSDDEKKLCEETLSLVTGTKDQLRGSDYREICIVLAKQLRGFVNEKVQLLLDTMTEITHILYAKVKERCQRSILRLHNQTFLHAIACEEVIGKPTILTQRKFYGRYFHSLICHAPIQHRIVCSRSTNTEQQERHFSTFSSISLTTSSRRPGEIITPGIIRMQAEIKEEEINKRSAIQEQESRLSKLSKCLPAAENSIIPHRIILRHPLAYQAHLERISDFLLCGEGVWWRHTVSGVEFFDVSKPSGADRNTHPPLHHFRSHTLHSEDAYLKDCWAQSITSGIQIPHHTIRVFDVRGNLERIIYTSFLHDDSDHDSDECNSDDDSHGQTENRTEEDSRLNEDGSEDEDACTDDDVTDQTEENIIGVVELGEDLMDQEEQDAFLEPQETEKTEAISKQNNNSTPTVEAAETINCSNSHNSSQPTPLSSTLAKNVAKIIGETDHVRKLDRARSKLRENPNCKALQEDYELQLAQVQTQVLRKHTQCKNIYKEWEISFMATHDYLEPTLDDIHKDEKGHQLYKTLRLCRQLLNHWNITVHL